jgi:hypothetical protein
MLSVKENFMRIVNKEMPEYVPNYDLFWAFNMPPFLMGERNPDGTGFDIFGVEQVLGSGICPAAMPKTHDFILTDITKWRDVIKIPDISDIDWEIMAKPQLDMRNPDMPFGGGTAMGFFQPLVAFLGFTEGLSACYEEPDEVKALMDYLCDFAVDLAKKYIYYYQPDYGFLADDIAHERNPFLSLPMFQELIAPYWRRYYDVFTEAGLPVGHHNCGHFELYLGDLVSMGVTFWDPVQSSNDYDAIKAKYGRNLALCTHLENRFWEDDATEEQVRSEFKTWMDRLAPGGGFAVFTFMGDNPEDIPGITPAEAQRARWINAEFEKLRYSYY